MEVRDQNTIRNRLLLHMSYENIAGIFHGGPPEYLVTAICFAPRLLCPRQLHLRPLGLIRRAVHDGKLVVLREASDVPADLREWLTLREAQHTSRDVVGRLDVTDERNGRHRLQVVTQ